MTGGCCRTLLTSPNGTLFRLASPQNTSSGSKHAFGGPCRCFFRRVRVSSTVCTSRSVCRCPVRRNNKGSNHPCSFNHPSSNNSGTTCPYGDCKRKHVGPTCFCKIFSPGSVHHSIDVAVANDGNGKIRGLVPFIPGSGTRNNNLALGG